MARLHDRYKAEIVSSLAEALKIKNPMAIPRLQKVVVSMGTGAPTQDKNRLPAATEEMGKITGQKAQIRKARRAVSNFKTRRGYEVGCRVTLRGARMYEFVDRLFNAAIPRLRDFRGLNPKSFDGRGNYSTGIPDQLIFAEIDVAHIKYNLGMNITFVTSARDDAGAKELLTQLGLPLREA